MGFESKEDASIGVKGYTTRIDYKCADDHSEDGSFGGEGILDCHRMSVFHAIPAGTGK